LAWTAKPVFATLLITGEISTELLEHCRLLIPSLGRARQLTQGLLIGPLPGSSEALHAAPG
jgi:hypothetical protein